MGFSLDRGHVLSTEELASIVNQGFQETQDYIGVEFDGVKRRLEQDREIISNIKKALAL